MSAANIAVTRTVSDAPLLTPERLLQRRVQPEGAQQPAEQKHSRETIDRQRRVAKCLHHSDQEKRDRSVFGKVGMGADRLAERRNAAVGEIDLGAHPVDDDVHGQQGGQKAEQGAVGDFDIAGRFF